MSDDDHGEHGGGERGDHGGEGSGGEHGGGEHGGGEHGDGEHGEHGGGPVGEVAGGVGGVLGGVADLLGDGEDTKEAREGLETASEVAEGVKKAAETAEDLGKAAGAIGRGNVGDAAGSLGSALGNAGGGVGALSNAIGGMVPAGEVRQGFQEAGRVANTVGQVARGIGQIVDGAADLIEELTGERTEVEFHLTVEGEDVEWGVLSIHFHDAIGHLTDAHVHARCPLDASIDEDDLLGKDVHLSIERGDEARSIRGIVKHAHVSNLRDHVEVRLDLGPALWLLSQTMDSRVYQDLTVPALIEQLMNELLGSRHRTVRSELTESYPTHEYLVQYRESHYKFLSRLCDEEGIFFYFDHDEGDHEILVLADSNDNRPLVREAHDGRVDFDPVEERRAGREVAYHVHRTRRIGPTDATVRGYDWTNPSLNVHHERVERGSWNGPPLEVYDHHHAVRHHEYDDGGGQYQSHTADRHSRMHTERLDLGRQTWTVSTTVVTAKPGHIFELAGADDHDDRYLIVSVSARGSGGAHGGELSNSLDVIPADMPYRPAVPARPMMPGPETATVVGPSGEEIHTDRHGRIKVQFHWDRRGERNEHSSAWLRVSQAWAGPGWGFVFIPRIGMEVIVSFLGGDPDRPIVTGCVYNGLNTPPYTLPDDKTKSTIKTNSSLGGGGSNELRFEDKKGSEEVYIHAEKDFNEVVENNHSTRVKNCQTNTVDVDQTETVRGNQTMTVKKDRKKTVEGEEKNVIHLTRDTTIGQDGGDDKLLVIGNREEQIDGAHDQLMVTAGNKATTCRVGKWDISTKGRLQIKQNEDTHFELKESAYLKTLGRVQIKSGTDKVHYDAHADGLLKVIAKLNIELKSGVDIVGQADGKAMIKSSGKMHLQSDTEILLTVGASTIKMTSDAIEIQAPQVKINASSTTTEINAATQVKIKC